MLSFLRAAIHVFLTLALCMTSLAAASAADPVPAVDRLSGPDRVATAAAVARDAFPQGAETVVMAGREGIPDALAGAALAREVDGPILLVDQDRVAGPVREALEGLGVRRIVLLGGHAVISEDVADELAAQFDVERVAGPDRFATAAAIGRRVGASEMDAGRTVLLGGGSAHPEILAASPLSHTLGAPVLLTEQATLSRETATAIGQLQPDRLIILGGEGRVSSDVAQQVSDLGVDVMRIAGANPLDSARAIADSLVREFGFDPAEMILARGDDVGDAVAGGVLAAVRNAPIALAESPGSLGPAELLVQTHCASVQRLTVLGGEAALPDQLVGDAALAAGDCVAAVQAPLIGSGLHVTEPELAMWRQRAASGPYRTAGDVSTNSPGDWERITQYADEFLRDPGMSHWDGPSGNNPGGCIQVSTQGPENRGHMPPYMEASRLRDAAFVALVNGSRTHASAVARALVAQARTEGVDFADRSRWCLGVVGGDNHPVFNISNWMTRLLFAYDYLQLSFPDELSPDEIAEMDRWFESAAEWMQEAVDSKLAQLYVDRAAGNYELTSTADSGWSDVLYVGGPLARTLHRRYNNRAASAARFVALVGVDQNNPSFTATGHNFVTEFLRFSYFPQGVIGEFERWAPQEPTLGWRYAIETTGSLVTIADALARAGDTSLYDYQTTDGALGTAGAHHSGAPKSLHTLVADMMGYVDGTYDRYATDDTSRDGDPSYRIDSIDDLTGGEHSHDTRLAMANRYYRDPYVRGVYARTAEGTPPYPSRPTEGQGDPEGGEWGIYPGMLFMFGDLEQAGTTPYPD